jgi:hypothetical protein
MGTPFIALLGPTSLEGYKRTLPHDQQTSPYIPPLFKDAMNVREAAFAADHHQPGWAEQYDDDDARSCHWVIYASENKTIELEERDPDTDIVIRPRRSVTRSLPIGTLRIVPFPHPPHPKDGARYIGHVLQPAEEGAGGGGNSGRTDGNSSQRGSTNTTAAQALNTVIERRRTWAMAFKPDRKTDFHDGKEPYVKLDRVAVMPEFRHHRQIPVELWNAAKKWLHENPTAFDPSIKELGMDLMKVASTYDIPKWNGLVCLHAQESLVDVYERWGFRVDKGMGTWYEDGIPHVGMFQRLKVKYVFPL